MKLGLHGAKAEGQEPSARLSRRVRWDIRAARLLVTIQAFEAEFVFLAGGPGSEDAGWRPLADKHLKLAKGASDDCRMDDAWEFLRTSQRETIKARSPEDLKLMAVAVRTEGQTNLWGWRRDAALAALAKPETASAAQVAEATRLLDEYFQNIYMRLRQLGARLVLASVLLLVVLVALGILAGVVSKSFSGLTVLSNGSEYCLVVLLGALGALVSFAIATLRPDPKIYQLASGNFVTPVARVMAGSAAAVIAVVAVEARVVAAPIEWAPAMAVAAGFSERLVRRIIESLSASAEQPSAEQPSTEQPSTAQPSTSRQSAEHQLTEQPATDRGGPRTDRRDGDPPASQQRWIAPSGG